MRVRHHSKHTAIKASLIFAFSILPLFVASSLPAASDRNAMKNRLEDIASSYEIEEGAEQQQDALGARDSIGLYEVLEIAALCNPGLEAAFNRWKAQTERISQAGSLPDPRFTFGHFFESVETRVGPQKQRFGLAQAFPWFGTLGLKSNIATQNALIAEQRFIGAQNRLYADVTKAYADYYFTGTAIANTQESLTLLKNAVAVVETKYRAGTGTYSSLIRGQVELGKLENELQSLYEESKVKTARLNALLNRPTTATIPPLAGIPGETLALSDEELTSTVREENPNLNALDIAFERESLSARLAGRAFYPNFTLGVDYISTGPARMPNVTGSGKDPIIGMFAINIPLWRGAKRAGQKEALARRRAVELEHRDVQNALLADLQKVLFAYHDAERQIALYRDALLPKAHESVAVTLKSYEAGEAGFLDVIDAQRVLLDFETAYERARANSMTHLAKLRELAGTRPATS